jgi:hypothetical protein
VNEKERVSLAACAKISKGENEKERAREFWKRERERDE